MTDQYIDAKARCGDKSRTCIHRVNITDALPLSYAAYETTRNESESKVSLLALMGCSHQRQYTEEEPLPLVAHSSAGMVGWLGAE